MSQLAEKIKDHKEFTYRIFSELQKLPFGALPKSELELLILDSLIRSISTEEPYSNVENHFNMLKTELKLSQAQLKNKILAAQLRYDLKTDQDVEKYIFDAVKKKECTVEGQFLIIQISNPLLNDTAKSYFEVRGILNDTSFNKTIIKINLKGFLSFIQLSSYIDENKIKEINSFLEKGRAEGIIKSKDSHNLSALELISNGTAITSNLLSIAQSLINIIT
jgi:hypothetical protein